MKACTFPVKDTTDGMTKILTLAALLHFWQPSVKSLPSILNSWLIPCEINCYIIAIFCQKPGRIWAKLNTPAVCKQMCNVCTFLVFHQVVPRPQGVKRHLVLTAFCSSKHESILYVCFYMLWYITHSLEAVCECLKDIMSPDFVSKQT